MSRLLDAGALLDRLVETGRPWIEAHGPWAIALPLFLETVALVGAIVPGYGVLVAAGYLAASGALPFVPTLFVAWLAACGGDQVSYLLGRVAGQRLVRRRPFVRRLRLAMEKDGPVILVLYHFAPWLRALLPTVAGTVRLDIVRWLCWDTLGVLLWVVTCMGLGAAAHGALHAAATWAAALLGLGAIALFIGVPWRLASRIRGCPDNGPESSVDPA